MPKGDRIKAHNAIVSHDGPLMLTKQDWRYQTNYRGNLPEVKARYVDLVAGGASQRAACRELGVGRSNLRQWLEDDFEFAAMVAKGGD